MKKIVDKVKNIVNKIDKNYLYIFMMCILMLLPYISKTYHQGDDSSYHLATIYGLSQTNIFDIYHLKIFGFFANNFGYGAGLFYPQLSHILPMYIFSLLKLFGGGIIVSVKITKFLELFFSGFFMYRLVKLITKNEKASLASALLYITLPYHLTDILIRDAMAECFIFPFIPVVFISLYYLLNNEYKKFLIYFVIGCSCLINSHLVLTMYFAFYIIIACIFNIKKILKWKNIKYIFIGIVVTLLICLPFLVPLIEHKIYGDYAVFLPDFMNDLGRLTRNKVELFNLFWNDGGSRLVFINNIICWGALIYTLFNYKKIKNKDNNFFLVSSLVFIVLSVILMSTFINWEKAPGFLRMLQFPWRLDTFLGFGLCLLFGLSFEKIKFLTLKEDSLLLVVIITCFIYGILPSKHLSLEENYWNNRKEWFSTQATFDNFVEYLPAKIVKGDMDFYLNRKQEIRIIDGEAEILDFENNVPKMTFKVTDVEEATIEAPRIYYLGYTIKATYEDGSKEVLDYYENDYGFVEFKLDKDATININYTGTKYDNIGNVISFITSIGCISYVIINNSKKKKLLANNN